jgi:rhamnopyranosyl-N-acetylglucosaminyl-diphospho-decaprenol beta-1,3/1,4-galactofuranosyltransferase
MKKVIVGIVTYNRSELLIEGLSALVNQSYKIEKILIVDNASTDNTEESVKNFFKENMEVNYSYNKMQENLGGAGGFSKTFELAQSEDFDYLWLMDDDVEPLKDTLSRLVQTSLEHNYDVVQPLRKYVDGEIVNYASKNWLFDKGTYSLSEGYDLTNLISSNVSHIPICSVPFEGPLISKKVINEVGLPESNFFIFHDDTDYSIRVCKKGFKIGMDLQSILIRKIKPSNAKGDFDFNWRSYFMERNYIRVAKKYQKANLKTIVRERYMVLLKSIIKTNASLSNKVKMIKLLNKSFYDGWKGNKGKRISW